MELGLFTNITFQSIAVSAIGIFGFVVGALVYSRDIRRIDNLAFFLLAWSFSMWSLLLGVFESIDISSLEYLILISVYMFAALIPPAVMFFAMTLFVGGKTTFTPLKISFIVAPFALIAVLLFIPDFFFMDIKNNGTAAKEIIFGPGFIIFATYVFLYITASIVLLFKKFKRSAGVFRTEILYVLLSIFIGALFILFVNIAFPYVDIYSLFWVGPLAGIFVLCTIAYLVIKYNFWNLKLAATDLFTSLISLTLLFELTLSNSLTDFIIKILILALVLISGLFLVRSVRHEIDSREEVEKLAKDLAKVNNNLHILDKQKSIFVATSAHHLRDPLTAIKGYASMTLEGSFGKLSKDSKEAMDRILKSSQRLVVIINDFMDIEKIESGEMDYVFSKVDLKKMIKDMVVEMTPIAKDSGLELKFNFDDTKEYRVNADEGKIRQVVSNLVDNAIKYTPHGSVCISLTKQSDGKEITLKIFDTGIGMKQDTIKKIFHKFSRADEASKFHTGGSGLGLYVAKEILKKHNGRIWAESPGLGEGSAFYLELKSM